MIVVRAVELHDLIPLSRLAQAMEEGLTNLPSLPRHPLDLEKRIAFSVESFARKTSNGSEIYLFVLEDIENKELIGTAQLVAKTLGSTLGYYYRQEPYVQSANRLQGQKSIPFLRPIRHIVESTELGGLFIHPAARQRGLSKLLLLGRLLFIVSYPERFQPTLIAEMRGVTDAHGNSLFWNAIGRHFLDIPFDELMRQVTLDPSFVSEILPPFPICLNMLPSEIQNLAGTTHPQSEMAQQKLFEEGFHLTGEIDIFDGGPKISADVRSLTVQHTHKTARAVCASLSSTHQETMILTNHHSLFRVVLAPMHLQSPETVLIEPKTAQLLKVSTGELMHYLPIHKHATTEHS